MTATGYDTAAAFARKFNPISRDESKKAKVTDCHLCGWG